MIAWQDKGRNAVLVDNDQHGNRLLFSFVRDYQIIFGKQEMNIGCDSCFNSYYNKLTKFLKEMKNSKSKKSSAILLKKYEGIQLFFGSKVHVYNKTMTEDQAEYLLEKHPHGAKLFHTLPEKKEKKDKQLKKDELIAKYPDIDPKLNKKDFLKAVAELSK